MGNNSVIQYWYIFWIIEAIVSISIVGVFAVICRWVFSLLGSYRGKRRSFKHAIVRWFSTLRPYRSPRVSDSKAVNPTPNNTTKRSG